MKLFIVVLEGFGKRIEEKVQANSREEAKDKVMVKYGVSVTSRPAS